MRTAYLFLLLLASSGAWAQPANEKAIRKLMAAQELAWNSGNIPGFMEGYWKNDSLLFVGKSGPNYGWQHTLDNYQKNYPDTATMGQLQFDILQTKKLSGKYYFVLGKWFLKKKIKRRCGRRFYTPVP